jgi:hypothetical protein
LVGLDKLEFVTITSEKAPARSLQVLPHLRLKRLTVDVWCASDAGFIGRARGPLEFLWLVQWPEPTFLTIASLKAREMKIIGASATTSRGLNHHGLSFLWFGHCAKLERLEELRVPKLWIDASNRLDWSSLRDVDGLRSLTLRSIKRMSSLDFVRSCHTLGALTITATQIPDDRSALVDSESLRLAWLPLPNDQLLAIGKANPRLTLGNGKVAISDGELRSAGIYDDAAHAFYLALKNAGS